MTSNQINYAKYREDQRTHLANEEIARMNAATNARNADISAGQLAEAQRANRANESLKAQQIATTYLVDMTKAEESARHNVQTEREQASSRETEAALRTQADATTRRGQNISGAGKIFDAVLGAGKFVAGLLA